MTANRTEQIIRNVEKHRQRIFDAHAYIWAHPETGYREWKTSAYLEAAFEELGYTIVKAGNIPGFYADLDTGRPGPKVLIMGELDSLICDGHPEAAESTHYVHACGHSAQAAALVGIAAALKEPGALEGLCGSVRLMAVPAEELIETGYRETLRQQGIIRYYGGKVEFMYRGYMDGVDIAFMFHTTSGDKSFSANRGSNGCITKNITFLGKAAHAGGSPQDGVNALYAASLGMTAINALRETFRDDDHIRVHPIVTKGGDAVNAIPATVTMESYVRGASVEAIAAANRRVNRALAGSAAAMGANVSLSDRPGYFPLHNNTVLMDIAHQAMARLVPEEEIALGSGWSTGCTDMGDISSVIPAIHPYCGGAVGTGHGADYFIADVEKACVLSAKCQVQLLNLLLAEDAHNAKRVLADRQTIYPTIQDYFASVDKLFMDKKAVQLCEDGTVTLDF